MSGKSIDKKLNNAYGKIGKILGYKFKLYRSFDYMNPVQDKNYLKTVDLAFSIDENFKKQQDFSFHIYNLFCKGETIQQGDIFVSEELDKKFTLIQNDPITAPIGVNSFGEITIRRAVYNSTGGYSAKTEDIATKIPATVLEVSSAGDQGLAQQSALATGVQQWEIWTWLPHGTIKLNDSIEDNLGNKSTVQSIQFTPLGYKIKVKSTK